jgi:DNA topoisomerase-3
MATTIVADVAGEQFKATGKTVTRAGWRELYAAEAEEDDAPTEGEGADQALPAMAKGDALTCAKVTRADEKTKAPPRFTEGTLGIAMENIHRFITDPAAKKILKEGDGIGTPATRASIIAELKRRNFIEPKGKKQIISTALGRGLIDALPPEVKSAALTAAFERTLREIEKGRASVDAFVAAQVEFVKATVAKANQGSITIAGTVGPSCPQCRTGFLRRLPRKGDKGGFFWGCNRYAEGCKAIFNDHKGKPDLASGVTAPPVDCPKCQADGKTGKLRLLKGATSMFWGCSRYAEGCRTSYPDAGGKPNFNPTPRK